ncbi:MAG: deoxyribose-phosphate aldolase [Clostridia bacterium]|nr:deoxyribose-phosphate aldolase [Clostridia bacterium]
MTNKEMLRHIDHTLLKATSDWAGITQLCEEAIANQTASVCIPACYVKPLHEKYGDRLNLCTVIGFPLGYSTTAVKVFEAQQAVFEGANEVDMVVNLCDVKNGEFEKITEEIRAIKLAVGSKILKVIVEVCYLTEAEKVALCKCVTDAGADYIKTSTGFGTGGATLEDIAIFKANIGPNVRMKAAGGVRTAEAVAAYLEAGCDRIGTSSAVKELAE